LRSDFSSLFFFSEEDKKKLDQIQHADSCHRHWSEKRLEDMEERDWRIFKEDFNITTKGFTPLSSLSSAFFLVIFVSFWSFVSSFISLPFFEICFLFQPFFQSSLYLKSSFLNRDVLNDLI
jgi:hypothetical protein